MGSASAYNPHLTRAPYLTDLVALHVAINFATDTTATTASIRYGTVDGSGDCTADTVVAAGRTAITVGTVHEYQWTAQVNLPAAGTYCYRAYLGSADLLATNPSPQFTTQVPLGDTTPFSFDVMGDWGQVDGTGANVNQANLMTQIAASQARFVVTVGDNGYPNGSQINYGDLKQTGANTSAIFGPQQWSVPGLTTPIFTAAGNHGLSGVAHTDITSWTQTTAVATSGGRYQNDVYCCPNGSSSSNYGSEWYAFDAGNTRFYVLDSAWGDTNSGTANPYANDALAHFAPGTPEYTWLLNDLQAHPSQLKFAFFHYPLYSDNNTQPADTYLDGPTNLEGLLGSHGVQVVFNGHAHIYERNTPSAPGMPITYVTGGGGGTLEPVGPCHPYDAYAVGWSPTKSKGSSCGSANPPAAAANVYSFLKVTVSGASVTVTPTDSLGNTFDSQTYTFAAQPIDDTPPSSPTGLSVATSSPFEDDLTWTAATDNVAVTGYRIYRDGSLYRSIGPVTAFSDPVLGSSTHVYAVTAVDGSGNESSPSPSMTVTSAAPPVPLFADGFESGNLSAWSTTGGLTVERGTVNTGGFAAEGNTSSGNTYAKKTLPATYADGYSRVAFDVLSQSAQINLLRLRDSAGHSLGYAYLATNGALGFHDDTTGTNAVSSLVPGPGWHALELRIAADRSSGTPTGVVQVWLDNSLVGALSSTNVDVGAAPVGGIQIGETQTGRTYDVVFDDAAFGTSRLGPQPNVTAPTAPTGLTATATSPFSVQLGWDTTTGASGYEIYRQGMLLTSVGAVTQYTDTTALAGSTYDYELTSVDAAGNESAPGAPADVTLPTAAEPSYANGFETGDLSGWTTTGGLSVENTSVNTGSYAAEGNTTNGATYAKKTLPSTYDDGYARVAFLVNSQVSQLNLLRLRTASGASLGYVYLNPAGRLGVHVDATNVNVLSPVAPGPGWHSVELHMEISNGVVQVWLDGASVDALSQVRAALGATPIGVVQIGETQTGRAYDVVFDDAAFSASRIGPT